MSRLHTVAPREASGAAAAIFTQIKTAFGSVPNAYATVGSNAPEVLAYILQASDILKAGTLDAMELEAINLTVSQTTGCDYCLAAHTMIGKHAGLSESETRDARRGSFPGNAKLDALVHFVNVLVKTSGTLDAGELDRVRGAGFNDRAIVEIALAVTNILFTNIINRINDTDLDFPAAPAL